MAPSRASWGSVNDPRRDERERRCAGRDARLGACPSTHQPLHIPGVDLTPRGAIQLLPVGKATRHYRRPVSVPKVAARTVGHC